MNLILQLEAEYNCKGGFPDMVKDSFIKTLKLVPYESQGGDVFIKKVKEITREHEMFTTEQEKIETQMKSNEKVFKQIWDEIVKTVEVTPHSTELLKKLEEVRDKQIEENGFK